MLFQKLLFSYLLAPVVDNQYKSVEKSCIITHDIVKVIVYESFISLEALVFEIGTSRMSKSEVKTIIGKILEAKTITIKNPAAISRVFNTSETNNTPGDFKELLKFRQNLISTDKSMIFESLIKDNLQQILNCVDSLKNRTLYDPLIDRNYANMVFRLYDAIYDNLDIQESLIKEKNEFYRDFIPYSSTRVREVKMALSLGGTVVNLKDLLNFSNRLSSKNKDNFIREWVRIIFDQLENLVTQITNKDFIEQKNLIKKFIQGAEDPEVGNASYEVRTSILLALDLQPHEIDDFIERQKKGNASILKVIENIATPQWIIKYNKQIREDMVEYLLTLQPEDKKKILNHFY